MVATAPSGHQVLCVVVATAPSGHQVLCVVVATAPSGHQVLCVVVATAPSGHQVLCVVVATAPSGRAQWREREKIHLGQITCTCEVPSLGRNEHKYTCQSDLETTILGGTFQPIAKM